MNSKLLIIVGGVVFLLIAGVGGFMFLGPSLAGGGDAAAAEPAAAEGKAEEEGEAHESGELGAFLSVPERVVNLSGEGPYSVLQVTITLEFETPEGYHAEGGHGGNPIQEEYDLELAGHLTPIEDGLNVLLSSKVGTGLSTTEGKIQLKEEIAELVGELMEPHIKAVYFNSFFMQ